MILILIPIFIISFLELFLISIDYGNNYSTFVKISDQFEHLKFFNPKLPQKYFGNSAVTPAVIPDGFKINKDENTFRIFALGGSTTAGFPHPQNGSFPRLLKGLLQKKYPQINFEVINLGVSAINTITIREVIHDVLLEEPDLIILYAGHNEYYGALGPASNINFINNSWVTRIILKLKEFRTVQLVENLIFRTKSLFSNGNYENKTLMSQLAGKNLVPNYGELFYDGINQFESNFNEILSSCKEANVPIFVGTLASNLLQTPLCKYVGCDSLCAEYENTIIDINSDSKEILYSIKDKDELRFRAPEKINDIILKYSEEYNFDIFDVQKLFESKSTYGVIGDNLILDHLHPTYSGNMLIANTLLGLIENSTEFDLEEFINNSQYIFNLDTFLTYSDLDSCFAEYRVQYLKSDFPFSNVDKNYSHIVFNQKSIVHTLAQEIIEGKISWEDAHLNLADYYFSRQEYKEYMNEINILIEDKPFDKFPYLKALKALEGKDQIELIKYLLHKYHKYYYDLFSSKKLGDIYFSQSKHNEAIYFYNLCLMKTHADPKIYFNLSSSYFAVKNLSKALESINECLRINPNYPNAERIYNGLKKFSERTKRNPNHN